VDLPGEVHTVLSMAHWQEWQHFADVTATAHHRRRPSQLPTVQLILKHGWSTRESQLVDDVHCGWTRWWRSQLHHNRSNCGKKSYDLDIWSHEHMLSIFRKTVTIKILISIRYRQCHSDDY
jgi:hypothetical protein